MAAVVFQRVPIPANLVAALGPEATQLFWAETKPGYESDDNWWEIGLPMFVKCLVYDNGQRVKDAREASSDAEKRLRISEASAESSQEAMFQYMDKLAEMEADMTELRVALRESRAQVEALHNVIQRSIK